MRTVVIALALLLGAAAIVSQAAEKITLTTAYQPAPPSSEFQIDSIKFDFRGQGIVIVVSFPNAPNPKEYAYNGDEAVTMMKALNKANLTTKSLQRRIMEQLMKDHAELAGTVAGTPD